MKSLSSLSKTFLILCGVTGLLAQSPRPEVAAAPSVALRPDAVLQQGLEFILPELIIGGEWTSAIRLSNRSGVAMPTTAMYLVDNSGGPINATFITTAGAMVTSPVINFTLPPGSTVEIPFVGGATAQWGQAMIDLCHNTPCLSGLYGEVILRNRNATRPDFESIFPLEQPAPLQYMLWDHRNGLQTVLYLNNDNTTITTVALDFTNIANQEITTVLVNLPGMSSQILNLNTLAPQTNGHEGTLAIRAANLTQPGNVGGLVVATALRINPSNSFTPIRAFIPHL